MLLPILVGLFLGLVQVIIYMQSRTAVQYAAFAAARAFQVYGDRDLESIDYKRIGTNPHTNAGQSIAEAAAEKIIFESLLWEHERISYMNQGSPTQGDLYVLSRLYDDGTHSRYDAQSSAANNGVVEVNFQGCSGAGHCDEGSGVEVFYCLPIVFPGVDFLFGLSKEEYPCQAGAGKRSYDGIAIRYSVPLEREPTAI